MTGRKHSYGRRAGVPTGPAQGDMLTGKWTVRVQQEPKDRPTLLPLPELIAHHEAAAARLEALGGAYDGAAINCRRHIAKLRAELAAKEGT